MPDPPRHQSSPAELKEQLAAERRGIPFLMYRDSDGGQQLCELGASTKRLTVGRSPAADISLRGDHDISRAHAELQRAGDVWTLVDDGLSRNGTFVNGDRVRGRRRLRDGDRVRCGNTILIYRDPAEAGAASTNIADDVPQAQVSEAQRRVLVALARPFAGGNQFATPASNVQIASELYLSVEAVKTHLRALFRKFGIEELPQNQKRARLVELAFLSGEIGERDLRPDPHG
jgi:hypothetical protein